MQLSMIVDADWSDAAGKMLREKKDPLWSDRLEKLDAYVESVEKNADNGNDRKRSRNDLRHELYLACRKAGGWGWSSALAVRVMRSLGRPRENNRISSLGACPSAK